MAPVSVLMAPPTRDFIAMAAKIAASSIVIGVNILTSFIVIAPDQWFRSGTGLAEPGDR